MHLLQREAQRPSGDARRVEDILDQPRLMLRVAIDDFERPARIRRAVAQEHLQVAENHVDRRPQLVRQGREKLILEAARLFSLRSCGGFAREAQIESARTCSWRRVYRTISPQITR